MVIGGLIAGAAIIGASAAKKASKQQAKAGERSLEFQREVFETTEVNAAPFIDAGELGLEALLFELGLGDAPTVGGETRFRVDDQEFDTRKEAEDFVQDRFMSLRKSERRKLLRKGQTPDRAIEEFNVGGTPFAGFQESPGFKFGFQQGINAVDASAAASGSLFSGSTLQDLTKFGQGFASQQRGLFLDRLQSLVSVGQTGVGQVAGVGNVFSQTGSQTIEGIGNVKAAGTIGKADALIGGINSLATVFGGFGF